MLSVDAGVDEQDQATNTLKIALSPITAEGPIHCAPG
jgi:hypothetical protein